MRPLARALIMALTAVASSGAFTAAAIGQQPLSDERVPADEPLERTVTFEDAVAAYRAGDFDRATTDFAALVEAEPDVGRRALLHANAGTAAARADRMGIAVWHLEAARRLAPRDASTNRNLAMVRSRIGEGATQTSQATETLRRLPLLLTGEEHALVVAGLGGLALLLLGLRRAGWLPKGTPWLVALLLVADGAWVFGRSWTTAHDQRRAVVIDDVRVRAEPGTHGDVLFRLASGTVVRDEELRGDWRLIETESGGRGWAPIERVWAAGG